MSGKTYVTKGYSNYTNINPAQQGGYTYDHGPKTPVNQYAIETKSLERVRAPTARYTDFVGSPSKAELLKEYVHSPSMSVTSYAPNSVENSSPAVSPIKNLFSSPVRGYFSEESNRANAGPGLGSKNVKNGTKNINEGLGVTEESVYFSPRADPRRRGVLDELSTRAQPFEPQKRYARPASFVAKPKYQEWY